LKLALLGAAVLAALAAGTAHGTTPRSCGAYSVGPGTLRHGSSSGAACVLKAYRDCRPATYVLAAFGVLAALGADTESTTAFHIVRVGPTCKVYVDATFRVVPQAPQRYHGTCRRVQRVADDILATGCTGRLPATISLTGHE
jgi:hypothetical protein